MVTMDAFASAFGFDAKSDDVWTTLGKVTAVGSGTLSVLLGGSATPTECEAYCLASVGDIVFVAITKGRARAIACKGVDAATWRTALGLGSMATEDSSDYLPVSGGTLTGSLTLDNSSVSISNPATWRAALGIGTNYENTKTGLSVTANQDAYVQGAKITLPAGKYIIYTQWYFGSTSSTPSSTTVCVGNQSTVYNDSRFRIRQYDSWWTAHATTYICQLNSQTDIYSYGSCSLARSSCESFIRAIKVG